MFAESFGPLGISVAQFTERQAGHVRVTDLRDVLPPMVAAALVC
ncbi:hypothetical protein [Streptomyces phyllanthi]|nr:hypothetical protein [Streptomyces phyllanthi]